MRNGHEILAQVNFVARVQGLQLRITWDKLRLTGNITRSHDTTTLSLLTRTPGCSICGYYDKYALKSPACRFHKDIMDSLQLQHMWANCWVTSPCCKWRQSDDRFSLLRGDCYTMSLGEAGKSCNFICWSHPACVAVAAVCWEPSDCPIGLAIGFRLM